MPLTLTPVRRTTARRTVIALHCSGAGGRVFDSYRTLMSADTELIAPDLLGSGAEARWPLGAPVIEPRPSAWRRCWRVGGTACT